MNILEQVTLVPAATGPLAVQPIRDIVRNLIMRNRIRTFFRESTAVVSIPVNAHLDRP